MGKVHKLFKNPKQFWYDAIFKNTAIGRKVVSCKKVIATNSSDVRNTKNTTKLEAREVFKITKQGNNYNIVSQKRAVKNHKFSSLIILDDKEEYIINNSQTRDFITNNDKYGVCVNQKNMLFARAERDMFQERLSLEKYFIRNKNNLIQKLTVELKNIFTNDDFLHISYLLRVINCNVNNFVFFNNKERLNKVLNFANDIDCLIVNTGIYDDVKTSIQNKFRRIIQYDSRNINAITSRLIYQYSKKDIDFLIPSYGDCKFLENTNNLNIKDIDGVVVIDKRQEEKGRVRGINKKLTFNGMIQGQEINSIALKEDIMLKYKTMLFNNADKYALLGQMLQDGCRLKIIID